MAEPGQYESTAYSRFFLGQTWRLELRGTPGAGAGTGWINSNQFYGGALEAIAHRRPMGGCHQRCSERQHDAGHDRYAA